MVAYCLEMSRYDIIYVAKIICCGKETKIPNNDTWQVWEEAVRKSYKASVEEEEFSDKATPDAVAKVAYYLRGCDVSMYLLDDTSGEEPNNMVVLLLDFLAFVDNLSVAQMRQFHTDEAVAATEERDIGQWMIGTEHEMDD